MERFLRWIVSHLPASLQKLYDRFEDLILYVVFGALTTLVSFITQFIPAYFLGSGAGATIFCTTFSWICSVTFAFFTNKRYVFKSKTRTRREFWGEVVSFYSARLVSYFLELGIMLVFATWLELNYYAVKICAQVVIMLCNYLFSKLVVFRHKDTPEDNAEDVPKDAATENEGMSAESTESA